jgi:hypothetical protein
VSNQLKFVEIIVEVPQGNITILVLVAIGKPISVKFIVPVETIPVAGKGGTEQLHTPGTTSLIRTKFILNL